MTGPARDLLTHRVAPTDRWLTRSSLPTAQPEIEGRPSCWRDRAHDDGNACALAYTPRMQQGLLTKSPGCERCWAGVNAAALYYHFRKGPL